MVTHFNVSESSSMGNIADGEAFSPRTKPKEIKMKTKLLILASALLLSTTAMATEPGKPLSSDPHGTPMPADQAGDSDDALITGDDGTVGAEDAPKSKSSDPNPNN